MPFITNSNPFTCFFNCQNTYLVFLKLEQDINSNIPVPFYFKPRERNKLDFYKSFLTNEDYMTYVNTTLRNSIINVLQNYGDNYRIVAEFATPSTYSFGIEFKNSSLCLIEVIYNSFKILFLVSHSHKQAILLNYFKHDENYIINEDCCIPQLDPNTLSQYVYVSNGLQYINTYEPYLSFKKKIANDKSFWSNIEDFMSGVTGIGTYSYYQIGNLIVIYDYQQESNKSYFAQPF